MYVRGVGEEPAAGLQAAARRQLPVLATKLPVMIIDLYISLSDPTGRVHVRRVGEEPAAESKAAALGQLPVLATKLPVSVIVLYISLLSRRTCPCSRSRRRTGSWPPSCCTRHTASGWRIQTSSRYVQGPHELILKQLREAEMLTIIGIP